MDANEPTGSKHVLVIDDDMTNNLIFGKHLEVIDKTITYTSKTSVTSALKFLNSCNSEGVSFPDMIFVDRHMPGKDGFYFLDIYEDDYYPHNKATKVFVLSSSDKQLIILDRPKNYNAVTDYIEKGFIYQELPVLTRKYMK